MSAFRFADPEWAWALWAVGAGVALLFWLDRRGSGALDRLVGTVLQGRLVRRPSPWRRRAGIILLGLAAAGCVLALMRPQLGFRHVAAQRVGAEIMIALDVSRSMLAEDVAPNRLDRAKAEIADLLTYLEGDQVGLIAFAGRATVLAPMTPDFGFLRLVLDGVGPHSVSRGGTRLEEPIRKAVQGFGPPGEAARAILLITDGEDHDSFPLDAAAEAAEAGIAIIAIGFGDESGSEIHVTNPETGLREVVRDADGRPVVSRLDGDLLRDLALKTGGAYVPAGTGVLDLESIYERSLAGLTTGRLDPRGRSVREEGYQWAVLLALVCLVASVAVTAGGAGAAASVLAVALLGAGPPPARAQAPPDPPAASAAEAAAEPAADALPEPPPAPEASQTPRERYNAGVRALRESDFDTAILRFEDARREAGADAELRFRAAYDLGLAHAGVAERSVEEEPEAALRALYTAADWFRDAVRLRPDDEDSRANLEVALRRALVLVDRLARGRDRGVDARLGELAERQRALTGELAGLVAADADEPELFADEVRRREFRARASAQRTLLADADELARAIDAEREARTAGTDAEPTPEDAMRAAQLEAVLAYLHRARELMGQTRRQLRQRQSERAYRRGASALTELKRALDQLRTPVPLLDAILLDAGEVARGTAALAAAAGGLDAPKAPAWLSAAGLAEQQQAVADRTDELERRLAAGLTAQPTPDQAELVAAVTAAQPFVAAARDAFDAASARLDGEDLEAALERQRDGILALADARERFLDLRGLIEAVTADEQRLSGVLGEALAAAEPALPELAPALRELQARNIERGERLEEKLREAEGRVGQPPADGSPVDPEAVEIERQRLDLAGQLLTLALARMDEALAQLAESGADPPAALAAADAAVKHLEALRRLFFSIVEQLRETARQQQDLFDATRDAATLAAADPAAGEERLGPLPERQTRLAARAEAIAAALAEQSNQTGGVMEEEADGYETSRRLRLAGEQVLQAQGAMTGAAEGLAAEPRAPETAQADQVEALERLAEALALLVPPEERQREQEPQQPEDGSGESEPSQPEAGAEPSPPADPAQLLQAVRDREAQRRRDRQPSGSSRYDTVEKDW